MFWMTIGVALIGYSVWSMFGFPDYTWVTGLSLFGVGCVLGSVTNGFLDQSQLGQLLTKIAIIALGLGILLIVYVLMRYV